MYMDKGDKPVRLASTFQENSNAVSSLQQASNFMQQVAPLRSQGVESWAQWCSFQTGLLEAMQSTKPPGLASGRYELLWFARSLISHPAVSPIQDIEGVSVKEFATAFPDSNNWLGLFKHGNISDAMSECKYTASPIYFTMYLCTIGSKDMNFDLERLRRHSGEIAQKRKDVESEIHMSPTPASCCSAVLNNH